MAEKKEKYIEEKEKPLSLEETFARIEEVIGHLESMDRRTWEAAEKILKEEIANLVIIGTP